VISYKGCIAQDKS